ncbi:hypothetical protein [Streptomyces sp. NPDC047042]|uniref:hypothetical protein n=1 Tax=Streptomyces sp. NPDC047042 TaxID=3154807 RepID=UPI003402A313
MSIAIGWAPTTFWVPAAVAKQELITLSPSEGAPGTTVQVGFKSCTDDSDAPPSVNMFHPPTARTAPAILTAVITLITWDERRIGSGATFDVPDKATPGDHEVYVRCSNDRYGYATFTVTPTHEARQDITLDPASGPSGTTVTVEGIGFNCSAVSVSWDDGSTLIAGATPSSEGDIAEKFDVPKDASETTHAVRAACTDNPDRYYADADFTVTDRETNGTTNNGDPNNGGAENGGTDNGGTDNGGTDNGGADNGGTDNGGTDNGGTENGGTENGGTDGETNGTGSGTTGETDSGTVGGIGDGGGGTAIPIGWVVGPSVFAAVLLLALLFSLVNHRQRGPRWVRDHIGTALRFGSGTVELRERRDGGSVNRTVRLEPHPDPGDQRFH